MPYKQTLHRNPEVYYVGKQYNARIKRQRAKRRIKRKKAESKKG